MLNFHGLRLGSGHRPERPKSGLGPEKPATDAAGLRAVIIEDELLVAWTVESALENLGHEVVEIHPTGESALSAGVGDATLLIVDINLGDGIDGIATAALLRQVAAVPVIFCTAYSDPGTRQRAIAAVPDAAFVTKPFLDRDFKQTIQAVTRVKH